MTKEEQQKILKRLNTFCVANNKKAILEMVFTLTTLFTFFGLMIYSLGVSYWLTFALLLPTAVLLTRTFTIQHDCGHYSYFSSLKANNIVGICLGFLTITPYFYWKKGHSFHHAFSGNLDKRGTGDIETLTVNEYKKLSKLQKVKYWAYRHPVFILILAPALLFGFKHRLPVDDRFSSKKSWSNIMLTNAVIALIIISLGLLFGWKAIVFVYLPVCWLASSIGLLLFFIHHQYEDMYWDHDGEWSYFNAGLYGSSYFEFTKPLSWLVANINLHHIHHLNGRIPFYRLRECFEAVPEMQDVPKRTFKDVAGCFKFTLWDEDNKKMVGFSAV